MSIEKTWITEELKKEMAEISTPEFRQDVTLIAQQTVVNLMTCGESVTLPKIVNKHDGKPWPFDSQIAQTAEEVGEFRHAARFESDERVIEEGVDVLLSAITGLTIYRINKGIDRQEFKLMVAKAVKRTFDKLYTRLDSTEQRPGWM